MDMNQFDSNLMPEQPQEPELLQAEQPQEPELLQAEQPQELPQVSECPPTASEGQSQPTEQPFPDWFMQALEQVESSEENRETPSADASLIFAPSTPPKKKRKTWLWILLICIGIVVSLVIGTTVGFFAGRAFLFEADERPSESQGLKPSGSKEENKGGTSSFDIATGNKDGEVYSYEQIVETVSPAIVNITVYSADGEKGSYASGIIMDAKQGYVLTNDHIYSKVPNAKFLITLNNGKELTAEFISGDTRSDIAILKIKNPQNLTAATFSTDALTVGERVVAIGQSYGYADTVTEGIVSAVDRRVSLSGGSYSERYIQTTAAINPGNSGGALVNLYGQVVGMTSAKIASEEVESLGFAIPADRVLSIVANLQKNGIVKGRAKLGVTYTELGTVAAEIQDLPVGIYVQSVESKSDAAKKGIRSGDVITKVNGKTISIAAVLLDEIEKAKAGDTLDLEVYHSASKKTETVQVALMEAEGGHSYETVDEDSNNLPENPYEFYFGE